MLRGYYISLSLFSFPVYSIIRVKSVRRRQHFVSIFAHRQLSPSSSSSPSPPPLLLLLHLRTSYNGSDPIIMIFFMHHDKCRLRSVSNIKHRDAGFKLATVAVSGPDDPRSAADDEHTRVAPQRCTE